MPERAAPDAVIYPGAPLRAVAIELRFRPLLDAMARFGAFQRRHFADYSRLYETSGDEGERGHLPDGREFARPRSAVLMARNRERAVTIARDQLAVITYAYDTGFRGFVDWALPTLEEGLADLGVDQVAEVRYRYENRIAHETSKLDLASVLRVSLATPPGARGSARNVHLYWHVESDDGTVQVEVDACPHVSDDEIHLNITSYCETAGGAKRDIRSLVETAHRLARTTFEEMITPAFRVQLQSARN